MKLGPKMDKKNATLRVLARMWAVWSRPGRRNRGKMLSLKFETCHSFSSNWPKSKVGRDKVSSQASLKMHELHSLHASCIQTEPLNILVTGAAGQIGYSLIYMIGNGDVFGSSQPLILHLLDVPAMMGVLKGVVMEVHDCAFPLVRGIVATDDPAVACDNVDAAFLVGAMPRKEGMERKDLLAANAKIFKVQGQIMDKHAKKTVKIIVVGNPANTNALICSKYAPSIPPENIHAMTRLDQNRAQSQIALRLGIPSIDVTNVVVWGNHSSTQFPDASHAMVNIEGQTVKAVNAIKDNTWLTKDFVKTVQTRGGAVIAFRKLSSALSAAKAARDHMRDIWFGTPEGIYVSMGVISDGSYGAPKGVFFSYPVTIKNKQWKIVQGLPINDFARSMLDKTGKELAKEREDALGVIEQ